jgi:very-short-patch-repair endonuclease
VRHSKAELAIYGAVQVKYPSAVSGQLGKLRSKRLELDIFIPDLLKAIEYDGTYFHPDGREEDLRKGVQCVEAGIQLLRVPEAEYEADPEATMAKVFRWLAL